MVAITINQKQHRFDSGIKPRVIISGVSGTPYIKLHDWQYFKPDYHSFILEPNNRTLAECPVYVRDTFHNSGSWTLDAAGGGFSIAPFSPNGFYRNGGTAGGSWQGGYYSTALTGDLISIQAKARSTTLEAGISLQNSPFTTHTYNAFVAHSLIFGANGKLAIFELGVQPKTLASAFRYDVDDIGMIEFDRVNKIIRYYLIHGREMILLRTTRPKFTVTPVIAEFMLFKPNSSLTDIFICNGSQASQTFENVGVARSVKSQEGWQKWRNQRTRTPNVDPIQLADGEYEFTSPSSKTVLRQANLTPKAFNQKGFQSFEDFYKWHNAQNEFMFVDEARKDEIGNPQEYWARFVGGMTDETGNGCNFDYGVQIVEAYRGDYVPRLLDTQAPAVNLSANDGPAGLAHFVVNTSDNVGTQFARIFVDGVQVGDDYYLNGSEAYVYEFSFSTDFLSSGSHPVVAKAYDFAGNEGVSNIQTLVV